MSSFTLPASTIPSNTSAPPAKRNSRRRTSNRSASMKLLRISSFVLLVLLMACSNTTQPTAEKAPEAPATPAAKPDAGPLGEMAIPANNPQTPDKIALGKMLFFDPRLSKSGKTSCETCHLPEKGWADGKVVSTKDDGTMNTRHTPTLYNVGYYMQWYWDG